LAFFAVGYALFGLETVRAGVLSRSAGLLIAVGALLYVVGGFSLPLFGPESAMVTMIETMGALPFGLGFVWLGYLLSTGAYTSDNGAGMHRNKSMKEASAG
jgi:hypothetical protein